MNENEIRLNAENIRLMEENNFLREMLNRLENKRSTYSTVNNAY